MNKSESHAAIRAQIDTRYLKESPILVSKRRTESSTKSSKLCPRLIKCLNTCTNSKDPSQWFRLR